MVLVAAGTTILRHRKARTDDESLLSAFHRLTAGLFRNTTPATQDSSEY
jgi:hypothetical protein